MTTLHAVIETRSRDCDGTYTGGETINMTENEKASDYGDIYFHNRVTGLVVNSYSCMSGALTVEKEEDYTRLTWYEPTEEGFREVTATISEGSTVDGFWLRDHSAEAAGY